MLDEFIYSNLKSMIADKLDGANIDNDYLLCEIEDAFFNGAISSQQYDELVSYLDYF